MEEKGAGLGWGRETTWGTEVAREANLWVPVVREDVKFRRPLLKRSAIFCRGNAPGFHRSARHAGVADVVGNLTMEFNYDGLNALLCNYFGDATVTEPVASTAWQFAYGDDVEPGHSLTMELLRHQNSLELYGVDLTTMRIAVADPNPLQIIFGLMAKNAEKQASAPEPSWVTDLPALTQHLKLEVDVGGGYVALDFDDFSLEGDRRLGRRQAHDGSSLTIRRPHREGFANWRGTVSRLYGEQDTGVFGVDDIYDEFLAGQTTGIAMKFTATGALISGSTYYKLTIEMPNVVMLDTGPITEDEGPRKEMIEFEADADSDDKAVEVTVVCTEDPSLWTSNPIT